MFTNLRLERAYQQVELVSGVGNPRRGRFCVMSFVAFLAGEEHSDFPRTASPLVREFAVCVNDALPRHLRQRLKPFAPRIIATNDGSDGARADLARTVAQTEILPRAEKDFARLRSFRGWRLRRALREFARHVARRARGPMPRACVGAAVAELLCFCGAKAPEAARAWYWAKAIELLDRLCDVTPHAASIRVDEARLCVLERALRACRGLETVAPEGAHAPYPSCPLLAAIEASRDPAGGVFVLE